LFQVASKKNVDMPFVCNNSSLLLTNLRISCTLWIISKYYLINCHIIAGGDLNVDLSIIVGAYGYGE